LLLRQKKIMQTAAVAGDSEHGRYLQIPVHLPEICPGDSGSTPFGRDAGQSVSLDRCHLLARKFSISTTVLITKD
jgi:hypothetical protein